MDTGWARRIAAFVFPVLVLVAGCGNGQTQSQPRDEGPAGWSAREGKPLKYRVNVRFGEEPSSMPRGWRFGRASAVATDSKGMVFVFQRGDERAKRGGKRPGKRAEGAGPGDGGPAVAAQGAEAAEHPAPPGSRKAPGRPSRPEAADGGAVALEGPEPGPGGPPPEQGGEGADKAPPILVFDPCGRYLRSWGQGMFINPHGIRIDRDDNVWAIDNDSHQVVKFSNAGEVLLTLGIKGQSGTGHDTFNRPTDVAFADNGDFYVADGYVNSRVVKFSREGRYLSEWGTKGTGRGQFRIVHSVAVDRSGKVYVADRANDRIQIFDANGRFLKAWTHLGATTSIVITPSDEMWILTHRNDYEEFAYRGLGGKLMKIELATGRILESAESPGHWLDVTPNAEEIYVGSLTGNVFQWFRGWPESQREGRAAFRRGCGFQW